MTEYIDGDYDDMVRKIVGLIEGEAEKIDLGGSFYVQCHMDRYMESWVWAVLVVMPGPRGDEGNFRHFSFCLPDQHLDMREIRAKLEKVRDMVGMSDIVSFG